jgi:sugar-specific transcriptional regulator TrmB
LGEETIKNFLKSFGLTERETVVYIFLAKHGVLKGREIAKRARIDNAEVYRILKNLQAKGIVESTLESPTRFTAVPFRTVLDSFIKTKRDEATLIEKTKIDLLIDWKKIRQTTPEPTLEKFVVFEGNSKIYPKICQMINETKNQLSAISTVPGLVLADHYGVLDAAFRHPLKSKIQFRFLTELSEQNLNDMKRLLKKKPKTGFDFKGRNLNLGLKSSPRMVVRDEEEIIFFITPRTETSTTAEEDVCLWTNCKALVRAFTGVFEDLWRNSTEIEKKVVEIETGKSTPQTYIKILGDAELAKKSYDSAILSAKEEIIMLTSSEGLIESWKKMPTLKELAERGVSIKIMAPVTSANLKAAEKLSECCEIKHVSIGHLRTTVVDGQRLFQFNNSLSDYDKLNITSNSERTFITDDYESVRKMKITLDDIWKNARAPSTVTLESTGQSLFGKVDAYIEDEKPLKKLTEKEVLNKIINAQKIQFKGPFSEHVDVYYGSIAQAVIDPPEHYNLPRIVVTVSHYNEQSSHGAANTLSVKLWLQTPTGNAFVPAAIVVDNPRLAAHRKRILQNVVLVKKDELQVRIQGNTLFAGWTVPIPLLPSCTLPPSCILFEGYGDVKTGVLKTIIPSGRKQITEYNGLGAFVTFFHPASKYTGPGTDGILLRDIIMTTYPPSNE